VLIITKDGARLQDILIENRQDRPSPSSPGYIYTQTARFAVRLFILALCVVEISTDAGLEQRIYIKT